MINKETMIILGELAEELNTSNQGVEAGEAIIFYVMSNEPDPSIQLIKGGKPAVFTSIISMLENLLKIIPSEDKKKFKALLAKHILN